MDRPPLVSDPDKVTPEWLTSVLVSSGALAPDAEVTAFTMRDVGTGQVGNNVRYTLEYRPERAGPPTVVCKFASRDENSRNAGIATKTYETEVAFYTDLADTVLIRRPRCFFAEVVVGTAETVLVLEDLAPAVQGDQIAGCSVEQAKLAMVEAAKLHAPRWGDPTLLDLPWLALRGGIGGAGAMFGALWQNFTGRYADRITDETRALGDRMSAGFRYGAGTSAPLTVCHGDYRLDNMLFGTSEGGYPLAVVDWQTVSHGVGTSDASYFLGAGLSVDDRRTHERDLVRLYHETLLEHGVRDYTFEACFVDYRRFAFGGFLMAVLASMIVGRTARGDEMFMAMANRHASQIADLESESLLEYV